jgi:ribonuclease VapC
MIADTSALIAILRDEPEADLFIKAIVEAKVRRVSAVSYVETAVVIDASGSPIASRRVDDLLKQGQFLVEPVTEEHARIAREAYRDFGMGRHRAGLNFGDCFAYALAKASGEPLLFKGDDFRHTDVSSAIE